MNPEDMKPAEEAGSEKQDDGQREAGEELKAAGTCGELKAFLTGKAITLKEVNDGVFSEGMMGEGMAIIPETEVVCSPADARGCVLRIPAMRQAFGWTTEWKFCCMWALIQ